MSTLSARLAARIDSSVLLAIAPRVSPSSRQATQRAIIDAFGDMLPQILEAAGATTQLRIEHQLAQVAHESDGFCTLEEYASGAAYEGRKDLGNVNCGDGVRFKGRGLIQLTGRANYRAFTAWMRKRDPSSPDFEARPELVATWPWAGWAVAFYWQTRPALNAAADRDDLIAVTKIVNGGKNGLDQRANYLAKIKTAVATRYADILSGDQQFPVLRRGMVSWTVETFQRALKDAGYYHLSIDGMFGPATGGAVLAFERDHHLAMDGVIDSGVAALLASYMPKEV